MPSNSSFQNVGEKVRTLPWTFIVTCWCLYFAKQLQMLFQLLFISFLFWDVRDKPSWWMMHSFERLTGSFIVTSGLKLNYIPNNLIKIRAFTVPWKVKKWAGWSSYYVSHFEINSKLLVLLNIIEHYLTLVNIWKHDRWYRLTLVTNVLNDSINVVFFSIK